MTCIIGPLSLDRDAKHSDNDFSDDATQKFTTGNILHRIAKRVQGLKTDGTRTKYNEKDTMGMLKNGWGIMYVNTSSGVLDENYNHKGWGILRTADETLVNNWKANLKCTIDMLSNDPHQKLTMDYTADNSRIFTSDYDTKTPSYNINDTFATLDTNVWDSPIEYNVNAGASSITADGTDLVLTGQANSLNNFGHVYMQTEDPINFYTWNTIEFDLKKVSTPASGRPEVNACFVISPNKQTGDIVWKNMIYIVMRVTNSTIKYEVISINSAGTPTTLVAKTTTTATTHKWKAECRTDGTRGILTLSLDIGDGNGPIQKYSGFVSITTFTSVYLGYLLDVADTTAQTIKSGFLQLYSLEENANNNVVGVPVDCTILQEDYTWFTRPSFEGDIPCCVNPPGNIEFICEPENFYDGSVKAYSSNNTNDADEQITNATEMQEKLDPLKFWMHNGLNKLVTTENSILWYIWNGTGWELLDEIGIGTIYSMKFKRLNNNIAKLQINVPQELELTLKMAKRTWELKHPDTPITITLKSIYEHDGTTTVDPSANVDITMLEQDYCNAYGIDNKLSINVATGTNFLQNTTGFTANRSANLSSSTTWAKIGTRSLKIETPGSQNIEGARYTFTSIPGEIYTLSTTIKGTIGNSYLIYMRQNGSSYTSFFTETYKTVTLTSSEQTFVFTGTCPTGVTSAQILIGTSTARIETFYIDENIVVNLNGIPEGYMDLNTGNLVQRYRMQLNQLNTATIKSDSIPASVMTGFGYYDSDVADEDYNSDVNIAKEWRNKTLQQVQIF